MNIDNTNDKECNIINYKKTNINYIFIDIFDVSININAFKNAITVRKSWT